MKIVLSPDAFLDVLNFRDHVFKPLEGFMDETTYRCVVDSARLPSESPWGLPITLEMPDSFEIGERAPDCLELYPPGSEMNESAGEMARLEVSSVFETHSTDIQKMYGTEKASHPGVTMERQRSPKRVGGRLVFSENLAIPRSIHYKSPAEIRAAIESRKWSTIVGFQTRNAIHRAHEYLQRVGLEFADGLFIHPLTGWKKDGDASVTDIVSSYRIMIDEFYPVDRTLFGVLETSMRYAGPREALFHAVIRKNYGCTHFIVGRDHAGVGGYYGKYEAQKFCAAFDDIGIEILPLAGPFHCDTCGGIATERSCGHFKSNPDMIREINGTEIRDFLAQGEAPPFWMMRPEIAASILTGRRCLTR